MKDHPVGLTALGASVLVITARKAGVQLTVEEAATVVAFVCAAVSFHTPRLKRVTGV